MSKAKLTSITSGEVLEFDVVESEAPEYNNDVTEFPVESGQDVADHVRNRPIVLPLNGVIAGDGAGNKIALLRKWRNERVLLRYHGRNAIANVVIEELQTEHDVRVRDGFRFRLRLRQVRIVQARLVRLAAPDPATLPKPAGSAAVVTQTRSVQIRGAKQVQERNADKATRTARVGQIAQVPEYLDRVSRR